MTWESPSVDVFEDAVPRARAGRPTLRFFLEIRPEQGILKREVSLYC